jgi:1-acyl-sn-glycerol-3-phosphate acyltransferase
MKEVTYYYTDLINDEFSGISREKIEVDENFKFVHKNVFWLIFEFIIHRIIVTPFAALFKIFHFHHKLIGKDKLKGFKGKYIIYGNHTQIPGDGLLPPMYLFPRKPYFVVNPDNIAAKGTKNIMLMLGAIPTPTTLKGLKQFENAIGYRILKGHPIVVYPEAHVWPYYTNIRPFKSTSFKYAIKFDCPVFCFTNCYQKRRFSKKQKMITYIDGPFYYNKELNRKEAEIDLRNQVYNTMCERVKNSTYEYKYHYIKKEESSNV